MQTDPFDTMVRNLESKLSVAKDNLQLYEGLFKKWRDDVNYITRMLEETKEARKFYEAAQPLPEPQPAPVKEAEVPVTPARPFPPVARFPAEYNRVGLNRHAINRRLRDWKTSLPLAASYQSPSNLIRQATTSTLRGLVGYQRWLDSGGQSMSGNGITVDTIHACAKSMHYDLSGVTREALRIHNDVTSYGEAGVDYLWDME